MFEKFTDRARQVTVLASEEAHMLNHGYIGTEHLLLGILREGEGYAAAALTAFGISTDAVRAQVKEILGEGGSVPHGHFPFTPRARKVMEFSLRESLQLGHTYIGTEHILLGLVREGEGVACQILVKLGADLTRVRDQVILLLTQPADSDQPIPPSEEALEDVPPVFRLSSSLQALLDQAQGFAGEDNVICMRHLLQAIEVKLGS